jgi:hypothetical protein
VDVAVDGFGPELFATMVTYDKITPGEEFTLTVTIHNYGQDTAREVDAYLRADFVSGWTIVDQFVTSISSYQGVGFPDQGVGDASWGWETDWENYNWFNRTNDIDPAELGVESVSEVVELHDWVKRRETPPQGIVLWMHRDRLEPGEEWQVTFNMISDVNMVPGMVYYETVELYYVDSINGATYGPNDDDYTYYTPPQQVLIRAGKGDKYTQDAEEDYSWMVYTILLIIVVIIIFILGIALGGRGKSSSPSEKPYGSYREDYEDEYVPPTPPPIEEEEEDVGPPIPEEKQE